MRPFVTYEFDVYTNYVDLLAFLPSEWYKYMMPTVRGEAISMILR